MGGCRKFVSAALAVAIVTPVVFAQQQEPSAADIKQQLEEIKKGRTLSILPADGSDDSNGATLLGLENASSFEIVILIVGPTTQRIQLDAERMLTLPVEPGDYEIAFTVVGRDMPPFYGKQKITEKLRFRHKFNVPVI